MRDVQLKDKTTELLCVTQADEIRRSQETHDKLVLLQGAH